MQRIFFGLLVFLFACGTGNVSTQIGTSTPRPVAVKQSTHTPLVPSAVPPTPTIARPSVYKVGDVIQVQAQTIILNNAAITDGILKANFTIANNSDKDANISSLLQFNAKDTEGVKLDSSLFDCGSQIDGKLLPGDKLRGDICWKTTANAPFRIYYEADLFGNGAVVWEIQP